MSVILARVDQRLIHGLIVNQWAQALQVKRFMVVDDELSTNEAIKASMRMSKPAGTGMSIINTEKAITNFNAG
ncbi:MAG: PTS sugar transporter subunit IIB, partial [Lactiplantibacillus plantarum]|nr:PTS sugar transporter subunit IIB [Lactiplantibacillus plantarum]